MQLETTTQALIRKAVCSLPYARVVRNSTGKIEDLKGVWHTFGLGKGGADLVGWVRLESGLARVLCIEVKRPKGGHLEDHQKRWLSVVNKHGGAAAVCRSPELAVEFCRRARTGELFHGYGPF